MTIKSSIRLSLIMHFAACWLALGAPIGCAKKEGNSDQAQSEEKKASDKSDKSGDIADKPVPDEPMQITLIEQTEEEREALIRKAIKREQAECKNFFGGIGVTYSNMNGLVEEVHKYYPAYDAGIKKGDVILNRISSIRGEVGTNVKVEVDRNGMLLVFDMVRDRICLKDSK